MHRTTTSETNQLSSHKHVVLIDTDIGDDIDDALALALALKSSEIELKAVTTVFGDTQKRARLAAHLLRIFGREDVPVATGVQMPMQLRHQPSGVPQVVAVDDHETFSAIIPLSGPEMIVKTALAHQGELTIVCLGPLTNLATALTLEQTLFMAIRNIVVMGGSSSFPLADWNVRSDARAAQIVLGAGIPITMIGFNVTMRCHLRQSELERLSHDTTPQVQLLSKLIAIWQRHRWHSRFPFLHDPLTVTALCKPDLLRFEEMPVRVLTYGPFKGYTIPRAMNGPWVHAAVDVKVAAAREWIMQRLLAPLF